MNFGDTNNINVICDNSMRFDVAPQGGDFNMYGGIYRDAWLIITHNDACISPFFYGSTGVFVSQLARQKKGRTEINIYVYQI